jgi:hypothetical protein
VKHDAAATLRMGRLFMAGSMAGFGFLYAVFASGAAGPVAGPPWYPGTAWSAWSTAAILFAAAIALAVRKLAGWGALDLGVFLLLRVLLVHLPRLAMALHDPNEWTGVLETMAMAGGAWVLAGELRAREGARDAVVDSVTRAGRFVFAAALVGFGVLHVVYGRYIAALVPSWIPGHLFWAYGIGVAFFASAIAIANRIKPRLAATWLGAMFLAWVLILHLPRSIAAGRNGAEWTSLFVALAMSGSAFAVASVRRRSARP